MSHCLKDEAINLGLAGNGRERAPTRAMVQDCFYGNFNLAICVPLRRGPTVAMPRAPAPSVRSTLRQTCAVHPLTLHFPSMIVPPVIPYLIPDHWYSSREYSLVITITELSYPSLLVVAPSIAHHIMS